MTEAGLNATVPDPAAAPLRPLRLKRREERRLRAGHLWIYSNEVDNEATPLRAFAPGEPVRILAANGKPLGTGYVNPHSLICARILSRRPDRVPGRSLLVHRLKVALALRERLFERPFYRLVYGEGDGLPGLVLDRYDDLFVAQITTAGMERLRGALEEALERMFRPRGILFRNDSPVRTLEGLALAVEQRGEVPEFTEVEEGGARFRVALAGGQKTGWFFDQRDNRSLMTRFARGARVLDAFSYVGGWGIRAALAGAAEVVCLDSSRQALALLEVNAVANGVQDRVRIERADAFDGLRALRDAGERFDLVILDPPAFIKRRKDYRRGSEAYHALNRLGMRLLGRDGILVSASCSSYLAPEGLQQILLQEARHLDRNLQLLARGGQALDHPVHPAIAETAYLKALFCRLTRH